MLGKKLPVIEPPQDDGILFTITIEREAAFDYEVQEDNEELIELWPHLSINLFYI